MKLIKETNLYDDEAISEALLRTVSNIFYDENMFNILTHNGTIQGLFWDNGQVYANMNYLRSGTIKVGGNGNVNGLLEVYNASQTVTCRLNNTGLYAIAGTIGGMTLANNNLHNGMTSLSDTSHDGVYVGTDGIALGKGKFKATNAGAVTAADLTITGGSITGTSIKLGGSNNGNGVMEIYNSSGTRTGLIDNTGANLVGDLKMQKTVSGWRYTTELTTFTVPQFNQSATITKGGIHINGYSTNYGNDIHLYIGAGGNRNSGYEDPYIYSNNPIAIMSSASDSYNANYTMAYIGGSNTILQDRFAIATHTSGETGIYVLFSVSAGGGNLHSKTSYTWMYNSREIATGSSSSKRYKHSIRYALDGDMAPSRLYDLAPANFIYNAGHPVQHRGMEGKVLPGFIAEDVSKVYPSATIYNEKGEIESWDERRIIPPMLALIQEQKKKIDELEETVNKFKQVIHVA